ncbi:MAG: class I SAM-dependent rRNA methyltransferase [Alicyclobacillus sp.]|nr:class I SAM-dependent rRNA methyltransferase [Alicyclobacillus sp.]
MLTATLFLQRNRRRRTEAGHPWVYQSEVARLVGDAVPGDVVRIVNHQGAFLARGMYNPQSQIVARVLTYQPDIPIDAAFVADRIRQAWAYRQRFLDDTNACRAVYGEADFLPGLIVDKYGDVLSVQILALGMDRMREWVREALIDVFHPRGIFLRNDVPVRKLEGLPLETGVWYGEVPDRIEICENGLHFLVDVKEGQKTGYFFDQRDNRAALRPLVEGGQADVLECFCHTGAFSVYAAKYGARHVTAVDISEAAIAVARENAARNGFSDCIDFAVANAFDYLREADAARRTYDVVILDPPAFAKSRRALEGALRGYKEINLRGLRLVRDGGFLATASCSFHVGPDLFREMVRSAAMDAHKVLRLVHFAGAGKDHPELEGVDEGHYLKFAIYQVFHR